MRVLRRLYEVSVWAPAGVSRQDWRFRGIFRFVLPVTDLLFFYFGSVGATNGVGSVEESAGQHWQAWWSAGIAVFALGALVGVSFPKLWAVEVASKVLLIGLISGYVALFLTRGMENPKVTATAGLIVILVLLPLWRIGDLGFVAWSRSRKGARR